MRGFGTWGAFVGQQEEWQVSLGGPVTKAVFGRGVPGTLHHGPVINLPQIKGYGQSSFIPRHLLNLHIHSYVPRLAGSHPLVCAEPGYPGLQQQACQVL